jgi:hypothetical protein
VNTGLNKEQDMASSFENGSNTSKQLKYHNGESRQVRTDKRRVPEPVTFADGPIDMLQEYPTIVPAHSPSSLCKADPTSKGHTELSLKETTGV